jgi:hypothetical protein
MRRHIPVLIITGLLGGGLAVNQASAGEKEGRGTDTRAATSGDVDESALVPDLYPGYDWACRTVDDAPVCKGELHHDPGWGTTDIPCDVPIHTSVVGDRWSTRYYGEDNRLTRKTGRVKETELFSTSPSGPAALEIGVHVHYQTSYDVPGDDSTGTQVTKGKQFDVRDADGRILFRTVGTLIEPYDGEPTFTGTVNREGTITRVVDAPLDEVLDEEWFFAQMCEVPQQVGD